MKVAWVLLALLLAPTGPRDHYPARLRNVLDSQRATTSQVEWTGTWIGGRDAGLVERYVTRKAGDAVWESNRGDENGYHPTVYSAGPPGSSENELPQPEITEDGPRIMDEEWLRKYEIPKEETAGTRNSLIYDQQAWYLDHAERPLTGTVQPLGTARDWLPVDLISIGLAPCWWGIGTDGNPFQLPESDLEGFDSATFAEGVENGLPTVSAVYGGGRFRLTWRFDDRYGGQPAWTAFERDGLPVYSSETEYEKVDERWFPKSVRFYRGMSTSPYKMIDVQRATFDEPWHIKEITPTDIGALYGTQFGGPDGLKIWTGAELIPNLEFWDLVELYDIPPDPRITEMIAAPQQTAEQLQEFWHRRMVWRREAYRKKYGEEPWLVKASPKEKDEWDVYVEKFLTKHKLPDPGVKRAQEIRDQAKKLRDARRRQNAAELRKAKAENDSRKIAHFEGIEKNIFDRVLVRSLEKLVHDEKDAPKKEP